MPVANRPKRLMFSQVVHHCRGSCPRCQLLRAAEWNSPRPRQTQRIILFLAISRDKKMGAAYDLPPAAWQQLVLGTHVDVLCHQIL